MAGLRERARAGIGSPTARTGTLRGLALHAFLAAIYPVLYGAVHAHYRRVTVSGLARFPRRGPALVVANHPCTWTDVLALLVVLQRPLHFIAESAQFRPWPRGLLLRLFGSLPIHFPGTSWDYDERNERTFRACESLFERGEVVVLFPEGISRTDWFLMPLKPGAARLAVTHASRERSAPSFALVPVGLRYEKRAAFRSDLGVHVGTPLDRAELRREGAAPDPVRRLTERLARTLGPLAVAGRDPVAGELLAALDPVAAAQLPGYGSAQGEALARAIASLEIRDRRTYRALARHARNHARIRRALGVSDAAVARRVGIAPPAPWRGAALLALPGIAGAILFALPAGLAHAACHRRGYGPSEIAFARIVSALAFLAGYAALGAALLAARFHASPAEIFGSLGVAALLGTAALALRDRVVPLVEDVRLGSAARRHPKLVARAETGEELLGLVADDLLTPRPRAGAAS